MSTYGPRFSAGYQFPRTHAARLKRGKPIRDTKLPGGASVTIVPLRGGRRKCFDVCAQYRDGEAWVSHSYIAGDELEARAVFEKFLRLARAP